MHYDCLSFREIPHTSRLFLDFLASSPEASPFFATSELLARPVAEHPAEHRAKVAAALMRQNRSFGAPDFSRTLANIERMRDGANAVVSGQQVGLLGGPLLGMLKAISAIKLAAEHGAVPVFWMATTDHDVAEIDHARFICDGKLTRISAELEVHAGDIVSRSKIGIGASGDLAAALDRCYPQADPEARALLAECYRPGERTGIAFAHLWTRLFADFGLILIDPDDPELHSIAAPIYAAAARQSLELNDALRERSTQLAAAGYHEQVKVTESTSLLFVDQEGVRTPVRIVRHLTGANEFRAGDTEWKSAEELAVWVSAHFDRVTPNALLRPVIQDWLLPTLAYIGGPAEIAYFAQSTVLYDALLGGRTPILPRASATLIEPRIGHFLDRYHISLRDLLNFHSEQDLALALAEKELPLAVTESFAAARERFTYELNRLRKTVGAEDATLEQAAAGALSKIRYQLEKLEARTARARLRRESDIARHATVLWNNLRPERQLQEREIAGAHFLLKYGMGFVPALAGKLNAICTGHQIIPI